MVRSRRPRSWDGKGRKGLRETLGYYLHTKQARNVMITARPGQPHRAITQVTELFDAIGLSFWFVWE